MIFQNFSHRHSFLIVAGTPSSVCSGVVAKVVNAEMPLYYKSLLPDHLELPAMLETTASVHPGGSGGAVVNSNGHMIGLVTRFSHWIFYFP